MALLVDTCRSVVDDSSPAELVELEAIELRANVVLVGVVTVVEAVVLATGKGELLSAKLTVG